MFYFENRYEFTLNHYVLSFSLYPEFSKFLPRILFNLFFSYAHTPMKMFEMRNHVAFLSKFHLAVSYGTGKWLVICMDTLVREEFV